jgi:nitrogenase molybdenum-cofactor synthesis protein NifE
MGKVYSISAGELVKSGRKNVPKELISSEHLIYSSPATLAFNSPGAQGFGVKRAGLAVPGSVMLLVAPGCCGRNTSSLGSESEYAQRFFYLLMDETDIVTGRHLKKIPQAVKEVCEACDTKPSVVMICITCVDALLGTDMERVCRRASDEAGVQVRPCYMYALTREGRLPPMAAVRKSIYSLLEPSEKIASQVNILGYFSPLYDDSEIYEILKNAGVKKINEISRCKNFEEYLSMSHANFNLVLNPEARFAAEDMEKRLGIPSVELTRMYQLDKIRSQYRIFSQIAGIHIDDEKYYNEAQKAVRDLAEAYPDISFAVGEILNADAFELSLALLRYGFSVKKIYGTVSDFNFAFIKKIAEISPDTEIFSNLSPSMINYETDADEVGVSIGKDAFYYHPHSTGVIWSDERQPFGYRGVTRLFTSIKKALEEGQAK